MDLVIQLSQGFGLAAAAGLLAAAPFAAASTAAALGWLDGAVGFADDGITLVVAWIATAVELVVDALWPGASAGARLGRRVVAGGLVFEFSAHDALPYAGLAIGAAVAAAVALAIRHIRSRAVKAGGGLRGTAAIEDAAGLGASALALVPPIGYAMAAAGVLLLARVRRRAGQRYQGLRVLR
jgi:hypothetical protein